MPRRTRTILIDRDEPDPALIEEAAQVLRAGGLVAFGTETVYGLGADATNPEAVARIFEAKGRPAFNPLIVHAHGLTMARQCVAHWPDVAEHLARRWWPGPLTLVLPRSALIPDIVTAGRNTVGVRVPHPGVARALIERTGRPIAAPSANRSTGISPTLAQHVLDDLDGKIDLILDSGPTDVGLESTVLDLSSDRPRILRPGPISALDLNISFDVNPAPPLTSGASFASPGLMSTHYAPRTPAVRVHRDALPRFPWPETAALLVFDAPLPPDASIPIGVVRHDLPNPIEAGRRLYALLHACDNAGFPLIVVVPPPDRPEWSAVRDRIERATRPCPEQDERD
ncbi:MAG: L-threonylcarbamoyladenylate synthase [Isosphaeraceae bacterium]